MKDGRKRLWPILRHYPGIHLGGPKTTTKNPTRYPGSLPKIEAETFQIRRLTNH